MSWLLFVIRELTLIALVVSYLQRLYVVQKNTKAWNGLGRALRAEMAVYLTLWVWFLVLPWVSLARNTVVVVGITVALLIVTIRVTHRLPKITTLRRQADGD